MTTMAKENQEQLKAREPQARISAGFLAARATVGRDGETLYGQCQTFQLEQGLMTCLAKSPRGDGQWRGFRLWLLPTGQLEAEPFG